MNKAFDPRGDCILHWLGEPSNNKAYWSNVCDGTVVTPPSDHREMWPPLVLFDVAYGCAIMEQFGADELVAYTSSVFPGPGDAALTAGEKVAVNKPTRQMQLDAATAASRKTRQKGMHDWYTFLALGYTETINRPEIMKRKAELEETRREEQQKRVRGMVTNWLEGST
ncbi:hypothetical protein K474DRAFT_1658314 [Panus rudis PR-1116 ss-1]|nr:hypothetical protein K474DRAFT_1658314 [Panus rudis PR-1116 ss-1]